MRSRDELKRRGAPGFLAVWGVFRNDGVTLSWTARILVCHEGTYHLWRRVPPGEKSIRPEADERRAGKLALSKPRDKGRLGRSSDAMGHNASEA
jgi:hypothetical protein